jgi:hypothetical protein
LLEHKCDVYSQTGEAGFIEAILDVLGERDHWCVDFGAWDGQPLSNTRNLIESRNYRAVLIEGDSERLESLRAFYKGNDRIFPVNAYAIRTYRPKVVCVEFNPTIPSECVVVQKAT